MNFRLLKIGIFYLTIILILASIQIVSADIVPPDDGKKSISTCYKINNIDDYDEYIFLRLVGYHPTLKPVSYSILSNDTCIYAGSYYKSAGGSLYEEAICVIPLSVFNESNYNPNASEFEDYFGNNSITLFSNSFREYYERVSKNHPLDSAVVNTEVTNINETCFEITKISVNYTYTDGTFEEKYFTDQNVFPTPSKGIEEDAEIPLLWFIAIPLVALIGIIIVILKRKRK